ncbi:hypothetical protein [Paenibacillus sp. P13VS]|uniref:hypothetical protein n=1 Tax=Paenibacillus sp. P13VS TaxID=2697367 RepID=UPI001D107BE3|nr:hypothetical protein [Paenibacillus sp. P13VS]
MELEDSKEKEEALKIDLEYIKSWESLHDSCVGIKRIEELVVCYLSGPEPQNDFKELISLGIHPQNIWAFEIDQNTYNTALLNFKNEYPQPKIVKQSIEQFFVHTPKKFDIVYIDACGTIASEQQCLRIIATLCKYHRLNSPGIIVTNFACPDLSKDLILEEYSELVAEYLFFKQNPNDSIESVSPLKSTEYDTFKSKVKNEFKSYYSDLITTSVIDIAALAVPIQRFVNSSFYKTMVEIDPVSKETEIMTLNGLNEIKNNSIYKYFYFVNLQNLVTKPNKKKRSFIKGFSGVDELSKSLYDSLASQAKNKSNSYNLKKEFQEIIDHFEHGLDIYQFLDKPNSGLIVDVITNQFAYPLHYNSRAIKRFQYRAKQTDMFMDVIVLDECRYIYEWLPSLHQIKHAFTNISWQYVFRFALDGLVKQRMRYNNEYFFQGSVISKETPGFENSEICDREIID